MRKTSPDQRRMDSGPVGVARIGPPLVWPVGLATSTWFGVSLLVILFVYSSVGSALPFVRQMPFFEMTELEWFCWWPFSLLIFLMCVNIVVATIRRIPLTALSLGAWLIHAGVLILCIGSLWYFGAKVEGDALIIRRLVTVTAPGFEPVTFPAIPGAGVTIGDDEYRVSVYEIQPEWELQTSGEAGETTYKVSLLVQSPQRLFLRELFAGLPRATQDLVETGGAQPAVDYARNVLGRPLADDSIVIALDHSPQRHFHVSDSSAIFLREVGTERWVQRPIRRLPRFNDRISSLDNVWPASGDAAWRGPNPLSLTVSAVADDDPLPDTTFTITDYLRYAVPRTRYVSGGDQLMPVVEARLETSDGLSSDCFLRAFDPMRSVSSDGLVAFVWAGTVEERESLCVVESPRLHISIPERSVDVEAAIGITAAGNPDLEFSQIEGTDYSYRVLDTRLNQAVNEDLLSVAFVELRRGEEQFTRWVFDDSRLSRDYPQGGGMGHGEPREFDDGIQIEFSPGRLPPAPITLIGGPETSDLRTLVAIDVENPAIITTAAGERIELRDGVFFTVAQLISHGRDESRPMIVPLTQRVRTAGVMNSQIRVSIPDGEGFRSAWLAFNSYAFPNPGSAPRRYPFKTGIISLPDGRQFELLYSRQRRPLPTPIVLDDFVIDSHIGGFTGETASIRNWTSLVQFGDAGARSEPVAVSVNAPIGREGYWYFQSSWDPPEEAGFHGETGSNGLNYTVLGVANRRGVWVQLAGCCLIVVGLIYAFYIKPIIRRRQVTARAGEVTS